MSETLAGLPNTQLLARVRELVQRGNVVEADLLAHLAEVDARRLYLEEGCSSMFAWCQQVLRFAEGVAYKRIQAARAGRRFPELVEAVRGGELHLTAVSLLAPRLTQENCAELIQAARHRSADEIRKLLADREPRQVATYVRRVPEPAQQAQVPVFPQPALSATPPVFHEPSAPLPAPRPTVPERGRTEPLGAERYRVQFMTDLKTHTQLEELRALMRHQIPDGDVGQILARAIAALHAQVRKRKFAETSSPRTSRPAASANGTPSRHVPAAIRRAVSKRDGGRCSYVSSGGRRCEAREFLEFEHLEAWAFSRVHSIQGITLRCRAHNQQRARSDFGDRHMARFRRRDPQPQLDSNPVDQSPR
jgi:hypothetical protein